MSQKKIKRRKKLVVDTKDFLGGIQALNVFYEEKVAAFEANRNQYGDQHPATISMLEEMDMLSNIISFFSGLVEGQVKSEGDILN